MRLRPRRLNTAIAALFMIGSFGFALGCTSAYASAVGPTADAVTFFVSSIFFTTASFWQLVQSQSPAVAATGTARDDERQPVRFLAWLPHDRGWLAAATQFPGTLFFNGTTFWAITVAVSNSQYDKVVWRPDFYGSILFLVSSAFAILALGRIWRWRPREAAWWVAWLNMIGSVAFMASAIGAFVIPRTDAAVDLTLADRGTLRGRRLLLPRRPSRHPGLAPGRGGRRSGGAAKRRPRAPPAARPPDDRRGARASCFFSSARPLALGRAGVRLLDGLLDGQVVVGLMARRCRSAHARRPRSPRHADAAMMSRTVPDRPPSMTLTSAMMAMRVTWRYQYHAVDAQDECRRGADHAFLSASKSALAAVGSV